MHPKSEAEIARLAGILGQIPAASVLLTGSSARGELAEGVVDGRREVFSDYEFFVVTPSRLSLRQQRGLRREVEEVAATFGYRNPLFHVDVAFRERGRLRRLPRTIFTYELKRNALAMRGPDVVGWIPEVTLTNLDWRDTNEILQRRLGAILFFMPDATVRGKGEGEIAQITTSYLLVRNALDLSTTLLPRQGILLSTYRERVRYWQEHGLAPDLAPLGEQFVPWLARCLEERESLSFSEPSRIRYPTVIRFLQEALSWLGLDLDHPDAAPSPFNEWPKTRGQSLHLVRLACSLIRHYGPRQAARWLRQPRKAMLAVGQLDAHRALIAWQQDDGATAETTLARSWGWLRRLMPEADACEPSGADFTEEWLRLRQQWLAYQNRYVRIG